MHHPLRNSVKPDFEAVNQFIIEQLHSNVPLVENIGHYIIDAGGKRIRPLLVLLSARCCNIASQDHIKLAAVIEFIHTATLLHDDVVDMSTMRRGRPTANSEWNNPSSVLVGDFIYSRAFQILVAVGSMRIMQIIADTTNKIAEGEVLQLLNKHNTQITEADYLNVIYSKTAILFQAAAQCGAILADAPINTQISLRNFGLHVGNAFQLIDDVLDYAGDAESMGKNIGDDLAEGKPTLPLIYAIKHAAQDDADLIRNALKSGGLDSLNSIIAVVKATGAIDYTRERAESEAKKAKDSLARLPTSDYLDALYAMADLAANRSG